MKPAAKGQIRLGERDVTNFKPAMRGIGYVPQDGALFTHMSVREHLGFALEVRRRPADEIHKRVEELAELLGIGYLLDRKPLGLSGGERQRVALGRALSADPGTLCLDEPLSALDEDTKEEMLGLLKSVREATGVTALHVTHSSSEARRLADLVFVLKDGVLKEVPKDELAGGSMRAAE